MKIKNNKTLVLETNFTDLDSFSISIEEKERTSISGWRSRYSKYTPLEFLKLCHEELGKMIKKLEENEKENSDIYGIKAVKRWWEFWK